MSHPVIAVYRPRPGKEPELLALLREHLPTLRAEGLVTERAPWVLRASDGALLEIFEWASAEAVEKAHAHPVVEKLWARFEEVCEYARLADLTEAQGPFAHFEPVSL